MDDKQSFQFFLDFYADLPRQGPGNDQFTQHILGLLIDLPPHPKALDMGCGSGKQSLILAQCGCRVTAVDLHQTILDGLVRRIKREKLEDFIVPVHASMDMYESKEPVDLIWSEGAIYIIGFENGLTLWKKHLKTDGYLVVSEMTWLTSNPPNPVHEFWASEYPAMTTIDKNQLLIEKSGYRWLGSILLPDHAGDDYYAPQKEKITRLRKTEKLSLSEDKILKEIEDEIQIFEENRGMFGYVFYLMQNCA